jgi:hypothetical protein
VGLRGAETMADRQAVKIAAFLIQALDLDDDASLLASELVAMKRDPNAGISSIELDSSVGPAAFLIYDYQLPIRDDDGETGQSRFDADLATLERAASLDSPGPRILAHAVAGDDAFILATTPAVHRALTGQGVESAIEATAAELLPGAETARLRSEAAAELLTLLRAADQQARSWLRAIRADANLRRTDGTDLVEFNPAEAELALFLLDERSIQHVLQALTLFVEGAKSQASGSQGFTPT